MHVASEALCKELYNLSGWRDTDFGYRIPDGILFQPRVSYNHVPAYDLGYLLRKLPALVTTEAYSNYLHVTKATRAFGGEYSAYYLFAKRQEAHTPEDAACRLAIELLKQGILKGEKQE